jgi:hypothetical protein
MYPVNPPFLQYVDIDGSPLNNGTVYFGQPNLNPETNPITVYWDIDGTQPAGGNVKTMNGVAVRNGKASNVFVNQDYSLTVKNSRGEIVYYLRSAQSYANNVFGLLAGGAGAGYVGFRQNQTYADSTVGKALQVEINVKNFPLLAKGDGSNDHDAIQAAFDYAATFENAKVVFPYNSGQYYSNDGFTVDTNKVSVDFKGNTINFSGMTAGNAWTIINSSTDGNVRNALNHAHPLENGTFVGPGVAVTTVAALVIRDTSGMNIISGGVVNYCDFLNFATDVVFGAGAFCWSFNHCNFTLTGGTPAAYSITVPPEANSGERNVFTDCMWNNRSFVLDHANANANTWFNCCSLDYNKRTFTVSAGAVILNGGHCEQSDDTDYHFVCSGANSSIEFNHVEFIMQNPKVNFSPFFSDSTCVSGGIVIDGGSYKQVGTISTKLIAGTGRTKTRGLKMLESASKPAVSEFENRLAYGDFENANALTEWTLSGSPLPVRSNVAPYEGSWSMLLEGSAGNVSRAVKTLPVIPGDLVLGELRYYVPNITGTGATFYVALYWLDSAGNAISGQDQAVVVADVTTWTRLPLNFNVTAPKGAASYKLNIEVFGTTSGSPKAYVDVVNLAVVEG